MRSNKRQRVHIGIDGGGTKTTAVVVDEQGRILGTAAGRSTNLKSNPHGAVRDELGRLLREAVEASGIPVREVASATLGLAGADRDADKQRIADFVRAELPEHVRIRVENDAVIALAAGTWGEPGVILIAGTGSIAVARGRNPGGLVRVGGWGYVLGDEGSGYDIGRKALKAVMRQFDGRDAVTRLSRDILAHLSLAHPQQLVPWVYEEGPFREKVAGLARIAIASAEAGDESAARIVEDAAAELAALAAAAGRGLAEPDAALPLIVSGGLFASAYFERAFRRHAQAACDGAAIRRLLLPPAVGAVMLSLVESGVALTDRFKATIIEEWQQRGGVADGR